MIDINKWMNWKPDPDLPARMINHAGNVAANTIYDFASRYEGSKATQNQLAELAQKVQRTVVEECCELLMSIREENLKATGK